MKLLIDVPDVYIPILKKWASVARTLNSATTLLLELGVNVDAHDDALIDQCTTTLEELADLLHPLDALHKAAQQSLIYGAPQ